MLLLEKRSHRRPQRLSAEFFPENSVQQTLAYLALDYSISTMVPTLVEIYLLTFFEMILEPMHTAFNGAASYRLKSKVSVVLQFWPCSTHYTVAPFTTEIVRIFIEVDLITNEFSNSFILLTTISLLAKVNSTQRRTLISP